MCFTSTKANNGQKIIATGETPALYICQRIMTSVNNIVLAEKAVEQGC
jgi:hypothetical protein